MVRKEKKQCSQMLGFRGVLVGAPVAACSWCKNKSSKEHMKNRNRYLGMLSLGVFISSN